MHTPAKGPQLYDIRHAFDTLKEYGGLERLRNHLDGMAGADDSPVLPDYLADQFYEWSGARPTTIADAAKILRDS
ncbi:hypothetical protein QQY66_45630 [Streptomyces sp. DG2A-72]|uniref:hypothetical protein n=1 Tax=Streptomyces sp. DG2A-72 TaxID=3051386 RepID=UPI00265BCFF2|nr:hypothetical protein [Streptomyces sp. DG2A-72]MDO0938650.1 hypothetical protein [Streptomyces sp. DG2A-72]